MRTALALILLAALSSGCCVCTTEQWLSESRTGPTHDAIARVESLSVSRSGDVFTLRVDYVGASGKTRRAEGSSPAVRVARPAEPRVELGDGDAYEVHAVLRFPDGEALPVTLPLAWAREATPAYHVPLYALAVVGDVVTMPVQLAAVVGYGGYQLTRVAGWAK